MCSGYHLGHSKALIAKDGLKTDSDKYAELDHKRQYITDVQVGLINAAIANSYSYRHWQKVVNAMILKEPGNFKI